MAAKARKEGLCDLTIVVAARPQRTMAPEGHKVDPCDLSIVVAARPQRTMAPARGCKEGLCDLSNVVTFRHNEQWRLKDTKVATKLAKISPIGNTGYKHPGVVCYLHTRKSEV